VASSVVFSTVSASSVNVAEGSGAVASKMYSVPAGDVGAMVVASMMVIRMMAEVTVISFLYTNKYHRVSCYIR